MTMARLVREDRLERPDDLFELLIEARRGLTPDETLRLDAKIILLLANHIGDQGVLAEAIAQARQTTAPAAAQDLAQTPE